MSSKNTSDQYVGVVGAGSFGTAVANLLARNSKVLLYARKEEVVREMIESGSNMGNKLHPNITPIADLEMLASRCSTIFPVVPSPNFRQMIKDLSPFLKPYHILIHGTKGLSVNVDNWLDNKDLRTDHVQTMTQVIMEESLVVRTGCLAGPNLAKELADEHPAATVVASRFDEVIKEGQRLLRNDKFQVYGSKELTSIELCGVLKNVIAIAAGALHGLGYGENAHSLVISRGLIEMVYIGRLFGGNTQSFFGLAGLGDLVATCSSHLSRNFTVGQRLAKGERISDILSSMEELPEGVNTAKIMRRLAQNYGVRVPITETLYRVLNEDLTVEEGVKFLMKSPFNVDIDVM